MSTGIELIAAERERQIYSEHWSADHDDYCHPHGELARAARCYAVPGLNSGYADRPPVDWPWEESAWKPKDNQIKNLVRAGALIAAEIDRLQRLKRKEVA